MAKDLIIGAASNYEWDKLKYWINSIRKSKFEGDVVLVCTNIKKETIDKLTENGVELCLYGKKDINGNITAPTNNAPHVERFFYIWNYLNNIKKDYRFVITTDTRDVIFQSNPSLWLENNNLVHSLIASSEGMRYKNEPWGNQNYLETFGPFFHNIMKDNYINNVGVIAGYLKHVKSLMLLLFQLSINRPISIVDQAVYNFILNTEPFYSDTFFTTNDDGWAIQLGTTEEAVKAGNGDLGIVAKQNEDYMKKYRMNYEDKQPIIDENGIVTLNENKFVIVHQWDRVPLLKTQIQKLYGDLNESDNGSGTIFYRTE